MTSALHITFVAGCLGLGSLCLVLDALRIDAGRWLFGRED